MPRSSLGHGAAGLAYRYWRAGTLTGDPAAHEAAATWIAAAAQHVGDVAGFAGDPPVFPPASAAPPWSVCFGEAGVWWVGAFVHHAQDDTGGASRAVAAFCDLATRCPPDALDAAAGAAGLLLGSASLLECLPEQFGAQLRATGDVLAARVVDAAVRRRGGTDAIGWLGAAHGWCGIAQALLRWSQATVAAPAPELTTLLEALFDARDKRGAWSRGDRSGDVWPGWCHGSAGWTMLWCLAAEVVGDDDLLRRAEAPAVHSMLARRGGPSLCCGVAGQAFAGLAMHRATGDSIWLKHARRLRDVALRTPVGPDYPEDSLWGGEAGAALLALELDQPARAAMPLFEPPR